MSIDIGCFVVSEATPSGSISSDPSMADWLWLKPSDGTWHTYNTSTGSWDVVGAVTIADLTVSGSIIVGSDAGITGEFEGALKKITIKNGIITEFELES